eukprot:g76983.t1
MDGGKSRPTKKAKRKTTTPRVQYDTPASEDLADIAALEAASYPEDEAATLTSITYRHENARPFFLAAWQSNPKKLVGFVNGTLTDSAELKHSTMSTHLPHGAYLCIHSVVVASDLRRSGLGSELLCKYVEHVRKNIGVKKILLISKKHLVPFYEGVGFKLHGPSKVVHGKERWYECGLDLESHKQEAKCGHTTTKRNARNFLKVNEATDTADRHQVDEEECQASVAKKNKASSKISPSNGKRKTKSK